jgi:ankyrin repeat protein
MEHPDLMKMLRTPNSSGYTVFHLCAHHNHLLSMMWIIQYVPLPFKKQLKEMLNDQEKTHNSNTPLHLAVIHGHKDLVSFLAQKHGKDIEFERQNALGDTVLHAAIKEYNGPIFSLLKRASDGKCNKIKNIAKMTPKKLAKDLKALDVFYFKEEIAIARQSSNSVVGKLQQKLQKTL